MNEPRLRALLPLWTWLPSFRVVAETEHLPTAAKLAATTPSSLSRAIALLERRLGRPLFRRQGRRLQLNEAGRELLTAVRDAMRRVDDGLTELPESGLRGALTIASSGAGTTVVVAPAVQRLLVGHPDVQPAIVTPEGDLAAALRTGRYDVVFQEQPMHARDFETRIAGEITRGVYCGREHPWFAAEHPGDLADATFVAPPCGPNGQCPDGWPAERPRRVVVTVDQLRVGIDLCRTSPWLAVLPDALAQRYPAELRRLPFDFVPPSTLHAICRRRLTPRPNGVAALLAALA